MCCVEDKIVVTFGCVLFVSRTKLVGDLVRIWKVEDRVAVSGSYQNIKVFSCCGICSVVAVTDFGQTIYGRSAVA